MGLWQLFALPFLRLRCLRVVLCWSLVAQFSFHMVCGDETLLYSPHLVVLLLPIAALPFASDHRLLRRSATVLAAITLALAPPHNIETWLNLIHRIPPNAPSLIP